MQVVTNDWLPDELLPVAHRLARADACAFDIAELISTWSCAGPIELRPFWIDKNANTFEVRVVRIRPVPPLVSLRFSEGIHHLRAALDNVVWHLVEQIHGPISDTDALLVAMPIYEDPDKYGNWVRRRVKAGLSCFDEASSLGARIQSLQPFADDTESIASMGELLALLTETEREEVHPLLLLQAYSNMDKHRHITVSAARGFNSTYETPLMTQDRRQRPVRVGDVLASGVWGNPTVLETNTGATIRRAEAGNAWVNPSKELADLRRYVADIAVPQLVRGGGLPGSLRPNVDLTDTGLSDRDRLCAAGDEDATARFGLRIATLFEEAAGREPVWLGEPVQDDHP